ncbi:hypothetical protein ECNE037_1250 [Escherichia coli NE037]|nr:hypothetical protein ECNE037_1250 [Escherichia coli NE037]
MGRINGLGWFPRCSPLANFENINQLPPYPDMVIPISRLDTWLFFRLNVNQAGGLYIPLITVMMIQVLPRYGDPHIGIDAGKISFSPER